jgi:hypothetical protein
MREKKAWRKAIDQGEIQKALEDQSRARQDELTQSAIPDSSLYKVTKKGGVAGLKQKREKLKADRFKEKERSTTSRYEEEMIKKIIAKSKAPVPQNKAKKDNDDDDFADLWNEAPEKTSRNLGKFKNFTEKSRVKVNPVVVPMSGQSYNPSAKDHQEVIEKVVAEEKKDV